MEKLPKVFVNPINHNIENVQQKYKSSMSDRNANYKSINISDVDKILNSSKHIYRSKVKMVIDDESCEKVIISRNGNYIITLDNEKIPITSINFIEEI